MGCAKWQGTNEAYETRPWTHVRAIQSRWKSDPDHFIGTERRYHLRAALDRTNRRTTWQASKREFWVGHRAIQFRRKTDSHPLRGSQRKSVGRTKWRAVDHGFEAFRWNQLGAVQSRWSANRDRLGRPYGAHLGCTGCPTFDRFFA